MIRNLAVPIGSFVLLVLVAIAVITSGFNPTILALVLFASFIFFLAFLKTDFALFILIFSMLLSPELTLGAVRGREVVVRIDDILLLVIFFGWLARMAINKELGVLKFSPLNQPIIVYVVVSITATLLGVLRGFAKPQISLFYLLKYFEYYLLFFMVINNIKGKKQVKLFIYSIISVCLLISIYACILHFQGVERVTAPFEGKAGEANTLGGYLVLIISIAIGIFLNSVSVKEKSFLLLLLLFALPALIFTLSRGSWVAFIPAVLALILLTRKGKLLIISVSFLTVLLSPVIFPHYFYERIDYTFSTGKEYKLLGRQIKLEEAAATRLEIFQFAIKKWTKEPILGYGVGSSLPVIDNQYARMIIEVGLIGCIVFLWLVIALLMNAFRILKKFKYDNFASGLIAGFIAGFLGLLVHAIAAETFILIRIMEPFWFLTAIIIMLPEIYEEGVVLTPGGAV